MEWSIVSTIGVLLVLGILLLAVEITVLPGFGVIGLLGALLTLGASAIAWSHYGVVVGGTVIGVSVVISGVLIWWAPRSRTGKKLILNSELRPDTTPEKWTQEWVGLVGVVDSVLRPSGTIRINDYKLDVVAQGGEWVEVGTRVRVVEVSTNSVVVVPVRDNESDGVG
ncbi:MAG: hypothetical protein HUU55_21685 [Myxococcales bacterium]|nr:hypothetical protein [Myxococcales bacterium]